MEEFKEGDKLVFLEKHTDFTMGKVYEVFYGVTNIDPLGEDRLYVVDNDGDGRPMTAFRDRFRIATPLDEVLS